MEQITIKEGKASAGEGCLGDMELLVIVESGMLHEFWVRCDLLDDDCNTFVFSSIDEALDCFNRLNEEQ